LFRRRQMGFARAWEILRSHRSTVALASFLVTSMGVLSLFSPLLTRDLVDKALVPGNWRAFSYISSLLALVFFLQPVLSYIYYSIKTSYLAQEITRDIRVQIHRAVLKAPLNRFEDKRRSTGEMVATVLADASKVSSLIGTTVPSLANATLTFLGTVVAMVYINPLLLLLSLPVSVGLVLLYQVYSTRIRVLSEKERMNYGHLSEELEESLNLLPVIKGLGAEEDSNGRFARKAEELRQAGFRVALLSARSNTIMVGLSGVGSFLILMVGGTQVLAGNLSVGSVLVFSSYFSRLYQPILNILGIALNWHSASASLMRVCEVLEKDPKEVIAPIERKNLFNIAGQKFQQIELIDVSVKGRQSPRLSDPMEVSLSKKGRAGEGGQRPLISIDATLRRGEVVIVSGSSGAGKSTLVMLLTGLIRPAGGRVRLNGRDITDLMGSMVFPDTVLIPQGAEIFSGNLRSNLCYGLSWSPEDKDLWDALERFELRKLVEALPGKLDHEIGQTGTDLSGGEKQRILLARAYLSGKGLIVLDETFSALDGRTGEAAYLALRDRTRQLGGSLVIVSHNGGYFQGADTVWRVNEGTIMSSPGLANVLNG